MPKSTIDLSLLEDGDKLKELLEMMPLLKRVLHVTGLKQGPGRPKGSTKKKSASARKSVRKRGRRRGPGRPRKRA